MTKRVTLSRALRLKAPKYYRSPRNPGCLYPVVLLAKKNPNWRIVLNDGRDFLVDPSTLLEVEAR